MFSNMINDNISCSINSIIGVIILMELKIPIKKVKINIRHGCGVDQCTHSIANLLKERHLSFMSDGWHCIIAYHNPIKLTVVSAVEFTVSWRFSLCQTAVALLSARSLKWRSEQFQLCCLSVWLTSEMRMARGVTWRLDNLNIGWRSHFFVPPSHQPNVHHLKAFGHGYKEELQFSGLSIPCTLGWWWDRRPEAWRPQQLWTSTPTLLG